MTKRTKIVGYLVALLAAMFIQASAYATNSFSVGPTRLIFDLQHPETQVLVVKNTGTGLIHLSIQPIYYAVDSKVLNLGTPLNPKSAETDSITQHLLFSPHVVTLQPEQQREIRVFVRMPPNATTGEYRAHLLAYMVEPIQAPIVQQNQANAKKIQMQLTMHMQIAVPVLAKFGKGEASLTATCQKAQDGTLQVNMTNASPWHFDGKIASFDNSSKPVAEQTLIMMRESKNTITFQNWKPVVGKNYKISWKPREEGLGRPGSIQCTA